MVFSGTLQSGHESPQDLFTPGEEPIFDVTHPYAMASRSSVILLWLARSARAQPDISVVGDAANGDDAIRLVL